MARQNRKRKKTAGSERSKFSRKDRRHLIEFGERHPADEQPVDEQPAEGRRETVVELKEPVESDVDVSSDPEADEESSESDAADAVQQLLGTFGRSRAEAADSDGSEDDDDDDENASVEPQDGDGEQDDADVGSDADVVSDAPSDNESLPEGGEDSPDEHEDKADDPYVVHWEWHIESDHFPLANTTRFRREERWPALGRLSVTEVQDNPREVPMSRNWGPHLKEALRDVARTLSPVGQELLAILGSYRDLLFPARTLNNGEEVRTAYCLHALNHVLKRRSRVVHHNARLHKGAASELRDQGLARPQVLLVLPFRDSALRTVNALAKLLGAKDVAHRSRFEKEFGSPEEPPKKWLERPEDYERTFSGNTDDAFRIGLRVSGRSLRLYSDFYSSDILIASPLGLRTVIGAPGEKQRDFDFLSSVEFVAIDQAEVFLMQNWEHLLHLMEHLNLRPTAPHGADFSRVRLWCLQGWGRHFRQSAIFSQVALAPINALLTRHGNNYAGSVSVINPLPTGSISEVTVALPQVFRRFQCPRASELADTRFAAFVERVLPQLLEAPGGGVMVYVRSYLDFVRLRNHLRRTEASFTQTCEYTPDAKVARARNLFFRGRRRLLLYTERFHFYRRYRIKGVRQLVWYELPSLPHFYPELCSLLQPSMQRNRQGGSFACSALYCKQDALPLAAVLGSARAAMLLHAESDTHAFVSGD
uniref:U3 small nucleolar RNA-associated protein 25 homolog n=1 Tax=Ixodes ricinus TaxID=34613 RepID=A0A131Y3P4_IXORI